jgi:hypothetical protein
MGPRKHRQGVALKHFKGKAGLERGKSAGRIAAQGVEEGENPVG